MTKIPSKSTFSSFFQRQKPNPTAPKAPQVAPRLREAEAVLTTIEAEHGALALAEIFAEPGAVEALADWNRRLLDQRTVVANLRAAHAAAQAEDAKANAAKVERIREAQKRSFRKALLARDAAARELAQAIAALIEPYERLIEQTIKASRALPIGLPLPSPLGGTFFGRAEIENAIGHELFRVGAGPRGMNGIGHPLAFPGARAPNLTNDDPAKVTPFAESVEKASDYLRAYVDGRHQQIVAPADAVDPGTDAPAPPVSPVAPATPAEPAEDTSDEAVLARLQAEGAPTVDGRAIPPRKDPSPGLTV